MPESFQLAAEQETGKTGIYHLKRFWSRVLAQRTGLIKSNPHPEEWHNDLALLHLLGLGLEQTMQYLFQYQPDFEQFEAWILEKNGGALAPETVARFNQRLLTEQEAGNVVEAAALPAVFSAEELQFWTENGYVVLHEAVPLAQCRAAEAAVWEHLGMNPQDPESWYRSAVPIQKIMVQLFQHPALEINRRSDRIRMAYEQLWGTRELVVSTDRVSFNPPVTDSWSFQGHGLHWDVSLHQPIPFGLQGLLYLTDTAANQGAFTLVPGFHRRIEHWLNNLPVDAHPRDQDITALGARPVAGKAGDFIIWHHALPHGSSPNTAHYPRIVQYINWSPMKQADLQPWI